MAQNKIIVFCYAYIWGIVLGMKFLMDGRLLWLGWAITIVLLLAMAGVWGFDRSTAPLAPPAARGPREISKWLLLILAPLALGYTRYTDINTIPDTRVGDLVIADGRMAFELERMPDETCRLRIRKIEPLEQSLQFRIVGELRARVPVRDAQGLPAMDAEGRWRFHEVVMPQQSDVIEIAAQDPVGTDYVVAQPFNRLERIEVLRGPRQGRLALYRLSNHISSFVRAGRGQTPVTLLGRVSQDPWIYDFRTVLTITPAYVQYQPQGPYFRVDGGDIRVTVDPKCPNYLQFANTAAYGYDVTVRGELSSAMSRANPGGFNQRQYMENYNAFGQMLAKGFPGEPSPIQAIHPEGHDLRRGNSLVEFSLALRDRLLRVIKLTFPYPQSAFMGGISLGLRYGLQSTECMFSDAYREYGPGQFLGHYEGCSELIADEFRRSGVNHVLAVSGLHVTIITIMFVGIFSLMRIPRKMYTPVIVLALVIFAIITGARPSSLRAVIMNSLLLLTWAYLDKGLRSSALLGVPVAAFLILLPNPAILVDPSFTLSFGAILSLALMTGPFYELLSYFKGNNLGALVILAVALTWMSMRHWWLLTTARFWLPFLPVVALLFLAARWLARHNIRLPDSWCFTRIPIGVATFIAAQGAIQMGMMVPLSSYYFCRWPIAGAFANLLAIPLVGIVLQLGMIACIIGLIPHVGIYLALLMNAADWLFASGFLIIAHYADRWFPYPFTPRPTLAILVIYYLACAVFIWRKASVKLAVAAWRRGWFRVLAVTVLVLAGAWMAHGALNKPPPQLKITVLALRYASSVLIQTPGGQRILVDGGFVQHDRSRVNDAERTIVPFLSSMGIRHLDGVFLTSLHRERASGIASVLRYCRVDRFFTTADLADLRADMTFEDFSRNIGIVPEAEMQDATFLADLYPELVGSPELPRQPGLAQVLAARRDTFVNRWARTVIRHATLQAGDVLFREQHGEAEFRIEVLAPTEPRIQERPLENQSMVLRVVYGSFAMLLTSDLHFAGQQRLLDTCTPEQLAAQVITVPNRGVSIPANAVVNFKPALLDSLEQVTLPLLKKTGAQYALVEFGNPRPVLANATRPALLAHEIAMRELRHSLPRGRLLNTERDLAIFVESNGQDFSVSTQAERMRTEGADDSETVSDLEVFF